MRPSRRLLPSLAALSALSLAAGGCALKPAPDPTESPWVEAAPWPTLENAPIAPPDMAGAIARAAQAVAVLEPQAQALTGRAEAAGRIDVAPEARGVTPPPIPQGAPIGDPAAFAALARTAPADAGSPIGDPAALEALARRPAPQTAPIGDPAALEALARRPAPQTAPIGDPAAFAALARPAASATPAPFDAAGLSLAGTAAQTRAAALPAPREAPQIPDAAPPPAGASPVSAADAAILAAARARAARASGGSGSPGASAEDSAVLAAARRRAAGAFEVDVGGLDDLAAEARRRAEARMRDGPLPATPAAPSPEAAAPSAEAAAEAEELERRLEELRRRQDAFRRDSEAAPPEAPSEDASPAEEGAR